VAFAAAVTLTAASAAIWTATTASAATPDTIWGTSAPANAAVDSDTGAVELGTRFTAVTTGQATGVRFYKTVENRGSHTGALWTSTGTLLAKVSFTTESSTGWQTATFTKPIALTAGASYVVSYHSTYGRYLATERFTGASASANLQIPTSNVGVYAYGTSSNFPTNSWRSTQYWVDLTFTPGAGSTTSSPVATPTATSTPSSTPTSTTTSPTPTATTSSTTPTPTPTKTTSTPPPALCNTSAVWSNLAACGWAGPGNTGYPAGQVFSKTVTGGLTISTDGTVIDGYKISGGVTVNAKNVVIKNSWITNSAGGVNGTGVVKVLNGASATIDHNLLDGLNATHTCIWHEGASMVATANECTEVNDGIFSWATTLGVDGTGDNFTIVDNWLHNFTTLAANGHVDGYQTEGAKNGVIRHNTFDVAQDQTSAISIWDGRKNASNIAVSNNLIQGGGFSIYAEDYNPSEASPAGGYTVTGITFTDNRFSNSRYACVGNWGVWFTRGAPSDGWHRTGNVLLETGQNLDSNNPIVNGWECR
jgi:cell division septation protein DedD